VASASAGYHGRLRSAASVPHEIIEPLAMIKQLESNKPINDNQ